VFASIGTVVLVLGVLGIGTALRTGGPDPTVPVPTTATDSRSPATQTTGTTPAAAPSTPVPTPSPLSGSVIAIDPGHNGLNYAHPEIINRRVDVNPLDLGTV
jgi:N-acetylmuramoyl-L-alanine amidase